MTRPFFTRERISDFDIYRRNCDTSLAEATSRLSEGYPIDFQVGISLQKFSYSLHLWLRILLQGSHLTLQRNFYSVPLLAVFLQAYHIHHGTCRKTHRRSIITPRTLSSLLSLKAWPWLPTVQVEVVNGHSPNLCKIKLLRFAKSWTNSPNPY